MPRKYARPWFLLVYACTYTAAPNHFPRQLFRPFSSSLFSRLLLLAAAAAPPSTLTVQVQIELCGFSRHQASYPGQSESKETNLDEKRLK